MRGTSSDRGYCGHSCATARWRAWGERYGPTTRPLESSLEVLVATARSAVSSADVPHRRAARRSWRRRFHSQALVLKAASSRRCSRCDTGGSTA
eukprot:2851396-Prymnesium_polylepis.1